VDGHVYVLFQSGEIATTVELIPNKVLADYSSAGDLIGLEILDSINVCTLIDEEVTTDDE